MNGGLNGESIVVLGGNKFINNLVILRMIGRFSELGDYVVSGFKGKSHVDKLGFQKVSEILANEGK